MISLKFNFKSIVTRIKTLIWEFKELHIFIFGFLLSLSLSLPASANNPTTSIFDLMNYQEVLKVTLETDLQQLKENRRSNEYQEATLIFEDAAGNEQTWGLKVKPRGKFRRMNCTEVLPLKFNFKKGDLSEAGLAAFDDMKLVPQCVENRLEAEDYLKREYLAYRMYNEISQYSYRVQLLRITYLDSSTGKRSKQWAFLIEDTAQLRDRLGAELCDDCYNMPNERFHLQAARMVAVYQYLIGNTDWSLSRMKNVKLLLINDKIVPIPYDFDFSGLVNASYAVPNNGLGQKSMRDRVYLGFKEDLGHLHAMTRIMVAKREKLTEIAMNFKLLKYGSRLDVVAFLETYFENPEVTGVKREQISNGQLKVEMGEVK